LSFAGVSHRQLADTTEGSVFDGCGFVEIREVGCTCFRSTVVGCDVEGVSVKVGDLGGAFLFQLGHEDVVQMTSLAFFLFPFGPGINAGTILGDRRL
jgi:hypothetical protein